MYSYQEPHHQTENESAPSVGVPASVIVSSNTVTVPALAGHDSQLTESWVSQSPSPGPFHMTAGVKQVEMPFYAKPHPLVAAAVRVSYHCPITALHFSSAFVIALFSFMHCFH